MDTMTASDPEQLMGDSGCAVMRRPAPATQSAGARHPHRLGIVEGLMPSGLPIAKTVVRVSRDRSNRQGGRTYPARLQHRHRDALLATVDALARRLTWPAGRSAAVSAWRSLEYPERVRT